MRLQPIRQNYCSFIPPFLNFHNPSFSLHQYLNIISPPSPSWLGSWSENFFYFKVSKGFIMCHTLCGLVRQRGAKVHRCNFISKGPSCPCRCFDRSPLSIFSVKQIGTSFCLSHRPRQHFRLEFPHAQNLDYPRFWDISFDGDYRPSRNWLSWYGSSMAAWPTQLSLRPRYQIP